MSGFFSTFVRGFLAGGASGGGSTEQRSRSTSPSLSRQGTETGEGSSPQATARHSDSLPSAQNLGETPATPLDSRRRDESHPNEVPTETLAGGESYARSGADSSPMPAADGSDRGAARRQISLETLNGYLEALRQADIARGRQPMTEEQEARTIVPAFPTQLPTPEGTELGDLDALSHVGLSWSDYRLYRIPLRDAQGRIGLVALPKGPILDVFGQGRPDLPPGTDEERYTPDTPAFIPLGISSAPFPMIFDHRTSYIWPIRPMPDHVPPNAVPQFYCDPAIPIQMNVGFGGPQAEPEPQPDPKATEAFVASLERADAELRSRMARLELGDIGTGNVGCAICLEDYDPEDRPEWIAGSEARQHECVVVPCAGFHTLHASCLQEWFAAKPPTEWACPFCRESLAPKKFVKGKVVELPRAKLGVGLREDVRRRERGQGWRCDSPACLPEYPEDRNGAETDTQRGELLKLKPCGHEHHLDCLTMTMRLDNPFASCDEDEEEDEEALSTTETPLPSPLPVTNAATESASESSGSSPVCISISPGEAVAESALTKVVAQSTPTPRASGGKWVNCPACRHEAWATLPRRGKKRAASPREQSEATQSQRR